MINSGTSTKQDDDIILSTEPTTLASLASSRKSDPLTKGENNNFNNFLKLLTTELKYQDPLKPLDPTQTVTQLATFSGVEQAVKTNTLLSNLIDLSSKTQAILLIGRTVSSADGHNLGVINSITSWNKIPTAITDTGKHVDLTRDLLIS